MQENKNKVIESFFTDNMLEPISALLIGFGVGGAPSLFSPDKNFNPIKGILGSAILGTSFLLGTHMETGFALSFLCLDINIYVAMVTAVSSTSMTASLCSLDGVVISAGLELIGSMSNGNNVSSNFFKNLFLGSFLGATSGFFINEAIGDYNVFKGYSINNLRGSIIEEHNVQLLGDSSVSYNHSDGT